MVSPSRSSRRRARRPIAAAGRRSAVPTADADGGGQAEAGVARRGVRGGRGGVQGSSLRGGWSAVIVLVTGSQPTTAAQRLASRTATGCAGASLRIGLPFLHGQSRERLIHS